MGWIRFSLSLGVALALNCLGAHPVMAAAPEPLTLTVHADRPGIKISPTLYGVFFEEINHAGDGGLYAELVRNRDFQETAGSNAAIPGWSLRLDGQAQGALALDTTQPLNAATPHSLRLDVTGAASGRVCAINAGYWGVPVKKGATYRLSLFARRSTTFQGALTVSLEGANGQVYAESAISGLPETWKRFERRLTANADDPDARLVLSADAPGSVWLDVVSLFPVRTWKQRPNGLRYDLASHVNALRPAFVRFPGGCYVEGGDRLADAFRWPQTIGDIAERPGHFNGNWGYRSTDGLGYHEYLQWCEDMGAEPLFVVNCGLSHKEAVPTDALEPWIQEALNAVEYANGPVTSKWGAQRARNGHPTPFHLRYLEIGNENGMFGSFGGTRAQYTERYKRFYDALKARYPEMQFVANTRVPYQMDIVDDHYYNSPAWFWSNIHLYDSYNRSEPKIYVGEYAVTQNCGQGSLRAALAEAAFLTGLEHNSDVVTMASYAPLFVNVHDRNWNPDAIVYDGARSYGTPSYYVQKLFAENRPDVLLPVDFTEPTVTTVSKGSIGLGTWRTQAEYKDITVTQNGQTVYTSDFTQGAADWKPLRGNWSVAEGAYRQSEQEDNRVTLLANATLNDTSDYTLHLKARKLGGDEGFLILFRARDDDNWYWWNIGGWGNSEHGLEKSADGMKMRLGRNVPGHLETGRWYDVKIEVAGSRIRCWLDDKLIQDVTDRAAPTLAAIAGKKQKTGEIVLKVVNGANEARNMTLDLTGIGALQPNAEAITLTSGSLDDENSLTQPEKVVPSTKRVSGIGPNFTYAFPARSLTILRLQPLR